MEQLLQRHIGPLQASQQFCGQQRKPDGADRQGEAQKDQAVFDRRGKQDDQGQETKDGTGDLPEEYGAGEQRGTEPDQIIVSISKLLYSLSCIVFVHFIKRRQITKRYPISFYLYPAIAFACLLAFWYVNANEPIRPISKTVFAVMSVLLFCSSMLLFVVYHHNLEKEGEYIRVKNEYDRLLDEKTHYDILEYQNQQLKIYAHDTRKHLAAISSLNSDQRIADYIEKLSEQLETYTKHCQSGNKTLDVIIDKYVTECELAGIQFYYDVRACNLIGIEAIDLVAILGNLLDNSFFVFERITPVHT